MNPNDIHSMHRSRREFLNTSACGIGGAALASMLAKESPVRASEGSVARPLAPRQPHFPPKAKSCIFIFMAGAPSQIDLFDPKPESQ